MVVIFGFFGFVNEEGVMGANSYHCSSSWRFGGMIVCLIFLDFFFNRFLFGFRNFVSERRREHAWEFLFFDEFPSISLFLTFTSFSLLFRFDSFPKLGRETLFARFWIPQRSTRVQENDCTEWTAVHETCTCIIDSLFSFPTLLRVCYCMCYWILTVDGGSNLKRYCTCIRHVF